MHLTILSVYILLVHQTVLGIHIPLVRSNDLVTSVSLEPSTVAKSYETSLLGDDSLAIDNAPSSYKNENNTDISNSTLQTEENALSSSNKAQSSTYSTSADPSISNNLTTIITNESHSQSSTWISSSESSAITNDGIISNISTTHANIEINATSSTTENDDGDETEGVARGKPSSTIYYTTESVNGTPQPQTLYEKGLALIGDPYTVSILIPIMLGIVFATAILLIIATCRFVKRRCMRRRLRRKALPDSVKNLRPSDRARLLAESSDEEF